MTPGSSKRAGDERRDDGGAGKGHRPHRRHHEDLTGQARRGHPWWVTALILLAVLVVSLAIWFAPTFATSSTSYCSSCKTMKPAYETWQKSAHSQTDCLSCHIEPGVLNKLRWRQAEAINIWSDYLGSDEGSLKCPACTPTDDSCQQKCHDVDTLPTVIDGIKMPHKEHTTSRNLECVDCHSQVAHSLESGTPPVSMASCSMCHNGAAASDECALCHVEPPVVDAHPPGYLETHGAQAGERVDDCLRCHHDKAAFCDPCHARPPASHFSGDWRYGHDKAAAADTAACVGCHDAEQFCEQCHKVTHPSDWAESHGPVAIQGDDSCLVCHPRSMCDECHTREGVAP